MRPTSLNRGPHSSRPGGAAAGGDGLGSSAAHALLAPPADNPDLLRQGPPQRERTAHQKRSKITPVACQPCQRRKHKCDGARPICTPCIARHRRDCAYDAAGDQRRTSALKQRIRDLDKQNDDLKDVITGIGTAADRGAADRDAAIATARQLALGGFQNTADVADAFRRDHNGADGVGSWAGERAGPFTTRRMSESATTPASPSTVSTVDSIGKQAPLSWQMDAPMGDYSMMQADFENTPVEGAGQFWPAELLINPISSNTTSPDVTSQIHGMTSGHVDSQYQYWPPRFSQP